MGKIADTYIKYGVPIDKSLKYESMGLPVTTIRATKISTLIEHYDLDHEEIVWIKKCVNRQPIEEEVVQRLLENSNFVCCCCKGMKSDSYIIHHIVEYEVSQDNSYDNLAVLCLNDHDLAHRPPMLTNKLTANQIRKAKITWEQQVCIHNIVTSQNEHKEKFLLKFPKYIELEKEIVELRARITDKEKIISRSEAYYDTEIQKFKDRIEVLNTQKGELEDKISQLALSLDAMDFSKSSDLYLKALDCLFKGNLEEAKSLLSESELESELDGILLREVELFRLLEQNADSWLLRAKIFLLESEIEKAKSSAEKALQVYRKIDPLISEEYAIKLVICLESIGTIYYNIGDFDAAGNCFDEGLNLCLVQRELGNYGHSPILAIILQNIGACYYSIGDSEESIKYLEEANVCISAINSIAESINGLENHYFVQMQLLVLTNLGVSYNNLGNRSKALEFLLKGNEIFERILVSNNNDNYMEPVFKFGTYFGSFYFYSGDYKLAQNIYLKIVPITEKIDSSLKDFFIADIAELYRDICATYIFTEDFDSAKLYCDEALNLFRQIGSFNNDKIGMQMVDTLVYSAVVSLNQEQDSFEKVEILLNEALDICRKYPDNEDARLYPETIKMMLNSKE